MSDTHCELSASPMGRRSFLALTATATAGMASMMLGCSASADDGAHGDGTSADADNPGSSGSEPATVVDQSDRAAKAPSALDQEVERLLAGMDSYQKVCQLFFVRPESITGVGQAIQAGEGTREALATYPVGGIAYFAQNIVDETQFRTLVTGTAAMAGEVPLWFGIDEEGGPLVARIANSGCFDVPQLPEMAEIGASGDPEMARQAGATIGTYLADLNISVDFAPVADVLVDPASIMAGRAFSDDPEVAASMVAAFVEGMQSCGVCATAKHFPGHGATEADSHTGAAVSMRTLDELRSCEFLPFKAAIDAGVSLVMVGHISTPVASGEDIPATLSPVAITDWLRGELGFDGVVVSDAMEMEAVNQLMDSAGVACAFIRAGGDMILMPADFGQALQGVLDAVASGAITEDRLDESVRRILRAKLAGHVE